MQSRMPSNQQAVKAWFRDYSSSLASVGITLRLTPMQQSELEHRLLVVCQGFGRVAAIQGGFKADIRLKLLMDPIRSRWLDDQVSAQGNTWAGA